MLQNILIVLALAGTIFFTILGFQTHSRVRRMSQIDVKRAELEEALAREERKGPKDRLLISLRQNGYDGDLFPFIAGISFLYITLLIALRLLGAPYTVGALIALPASGMVVWTGAGWAARTRRARFNQQLVELLELLAGQIESGNGAQKALQSVVPNMQEPLHSEMTQVLNAQVASKDLIGSMRDLGERYPSRAMSMFIAALEIDQAEGQAIGPALHQAADLLRRDFSLAAEARSEISQTKGEFFAVLGILGAISAQLLLSGDAASRAAYTSPLGLAALTIAGANVAFGIWRFLRILRVIKGDS